MMTALPTKNEVSSASVAIYKAAKQDLFFMPVPEGIKADLRSIVEIAASQIDIERAGGGRKRKKGASPVHLETNRFQKILRVRRFKISLDARQVHKNPSRHHTEVMTACMLSG